MGEVHILYRLSVKYPILKTKKTPKIKLWYGFRKLHTLIYRCAIFSLHLTHEDFFFLFNNAQFFKGSNTNFNANWKTG